ncbi:Tyrocidine synthase I [Slackia heliotrinireducens]|uniref:Non-ribosomal peptide synthase n=1 Tax=Slackia heliotrinireducens (strain ATCC 29202 / DSM 20476 / NCTC 11029 / RHS 1) TaxID=471855 RepID=C7N754_SLAHD|nr:amino acid adenylation domain-containing protein [Slackia heliotrinireducens]ACV22739.1 non-ribosomal peptide synthase [Slackia heliotrinireducens DSM 20476]VEH01384.1 Tyrocidine synthase I [Slackia heliotrinireducens]
MKNVLEWLEATAKRVPDKPAVCDVESTLTYAQLEAEARRIGTWLASRVQPHVPVALYMEKSTECLALMLGATYARCPYSVIDVRQPANRVASILDTLQPGIVLTDARNAEHAAEMFTETPYEPVLASSIDAVADDGAIARLRAEALDTDPLYVNFTSGSTGTPKGVCVAHRSVIDFIGCFTDTFGFTQDDEIANQAPFDFDVSVKDLYSGMRVGATVHLIPREYFSQPALLMDYLVERRVTVCTWAVSAMCFVSIMGGFEYKVPETISKVLFSGEVMPPKQLAKWKKYLPHAMYVNLYGPTEVTCNCTYHIVDRDYAKDETIPAGRAFDNERVFLLDEDDREVTEAGEQGEVCVCGTCLALGYYNAPERTAKAFMQNPLNTRTIEMMYRTGDIATWTEEGELMYVGRKDHQIKHLGQRIELGEIETAAQALDGITRACCVYNARKKRILMFYTGSIGSDELLEGMRAVVPQYMVPSKVFQLDEMPMTKNGKVDRNALAQMKGAN